MSQRAKPSKHEQAGNTPATNENAAKSHDEGQNHAEKTTDSATQPISNGLRKSARLTEEREAIVEAAMVAQQAEIAKTSRADSDKDDESSQGYENSLASTQSSGGSNYNPGNTSVENLSNYELPFTRSQTQAELEDPSYLLSEPSMDPLDYDSGSK